eukprot:COSAG02_NODE_13754_length_1353_cov_9.479339_2_plen_70_part_00
MAVQLAVAAYAYAPTNPDDLTLEEGDRIEVRSQWPKALLIQIDGLSEVRFVISGALANPRAHREVWAVW